MYTNVTLYRRLWIIDDITDKLRQVLNDNTLHGEVKYIDMIVAEHSDDGYIARWLIRRLRECLDNVGRYKFDTITLRLLYADLCRALDGEYKEIIPVDEFGGTYDHYYFETLNYWKYAIRGELDYTSSDTDIFFIEVA